MCIRDSIDAFVQADWKCPFMFIANLTKVRQLFTRKREEAANRKVGVKMTASEQLSVYPLIRRFAELNDCDELHDATVCFCNICDVADALQRAKFQHFTCRKTMAVLIKDLVRKYLDVRLAVYGKKGVKPKHHKLATCGSSCWKTGF